MCLSSPSRHRLFDGFSPFEQALTACSLLQRMCPQCKSPNRKPHCRINSLTNTITMFESPSSPKIINISADMLDFSFHCLLLFNPGTGFTGGMFLQMFALRSSSFAPCGL